MISLRPKRSTSATWLSPARFWQFNEQGTSIMTNRFGLSRTDEHWAVQGRGQCYKCIVEKERYEPLRDLSIGDMRSMRARTWPRQDRFVSREFERVRWMGQASKSISHHPHAIETLSLSLSPARTGNPNRWYCSAPIVMHFLRGTLIGSRRIAIRWDSEW